MVDMDGVFYFAIFVNHLILVGYAPYMTGSFPLWCQLGGALWRGGEHEDQATDLIGVGSRHSWTDGHLLVGELEPLSNGLYVFCGVLGGWRGVGVRSEVGKKHWFVTRRDHRGGKPVGFMGHGVEG